MIDQNNKSEAAEKEGVCHTQIECELMYAEMDPDRKQRAIGILKSAIPEGEKVRIRGVIAQWGHPVWLLHLADDEIAAEIKKNPDGDVKLIKSLMNPHHTVGMAIRNILRRQACGEDYLGVHNLDDIYINLIEDAVKL